jgi:large subunit ribosomal protein L4
MKFELFNSDGTSSGEKAIDNFPTFDGDKGVDALRQSIIAVHANKRQGNASTKLRSEVAGSGKKLYRQKGLGVGRAGDKKAIQRRGGGVIFGPRPRSYNQKLNKKIKRLALGRALFEQAESSSICLISDWTIEKPKTHLFNSLLKKITPNSKKILVVADTFSNDVSLAARNLSFARISTSDNLAAIDIVQADMIIFSESGLDSLISKYNKEKVA